MARKKKSYRRRQGVSVAMVMGLAPITITTFNAARVNPAEAPIVFTRNMTGVDISRQRFDPQFMWFGLFPIVAGWMTHKFIGGGLGINRALGSAGIPWVRI
ncbi:MAG TPA: hypothetical protein EYN66_07845 [Myxococcales bacterium]|nr:hypothetical protein [Myxococcales bacterium]